MSWLALVVTALADVVGRVLGDLFIDWCSRPETVGVEYGPTPLDEDDLDGLPGGDVSELLRDWMRLSGDEVPAGPSGPGAGAG